jgi:hypothetical protein
MKRMIALVAGALLLFAMPASAQTFTDPDDMTSPLDIRKLEHTDKGKDVHLLKVTTDDNWRCDYIGELGKIRFFFDGRGDGDTDLVGKVRCLDPKGPRRDLVLFLSGKDSGNSYDPVPINRPNKHTMKVKFSFDLIELRGPHVDLSFGVTDGQAEGCTSAHKCTEQAPDTGAWRLY